MSLFSKIEIKPEMQSFIAKGQGVGVVKVKDYGKASARIESHKIILESYDKEYPVIESIAAISYLSYDPGNFFQEPKLEIGLGQKEYVLAGVDNNDDELEAFYKSILNIKNNEKNLSTNNISQETPQFKESTKNDYDELDQLEEEFNHQTNVKDTTNKIKGFLSKRFELKEEELDTNVNPKVTQLINNKNDKPDNLEEILDEEELINDDDEEILLIDEQPKEQETPKKEIKKNQKEQIKEIEDFEDFEDFDEIDDFEELDDFKLDEEIVLEEDIGDENFSEQTQKVTVEEPVETTIESKKQTQPQSTIKKSNNQQEIKTEEKQQEIPKKQKSKQVTQETSKPAPEQTSKQVIKSTNETENKLNQEISQVKEQVNDNIKNINKEISNQKTENQENNNTFDPIYQIRRYYELKEEGIITEEEFNQKKKQLLEL